MNDQVKITINPDNAADYQKASMLEAYLNAFMEQVRKNHRGGSHSDDGIPSCPICLGLEEP